jgi:tellurite resistance protein TerC
MLGTPTHLWMVLLATMAIAIVVDFGVFHKKAGAVSLKVALIESAAWITVALLFNVWVYISLGRQSGHEFLAGYLVEKSLSVDNLFVFLLIFQAFQVPARSQHKVLYYGVLGALVMRAIFVLGGIELLQKFHFVLYLFGAILVVTGIRMFFPVKRAFQPNRNWMIRLVRRFLPVLGSYEGERFFLRRAGNWNATPLFLALVAVETMDIIFAVDSVPAVLAITRNPFVVYSSNAFAILGLRALYFSLAAILPRFRFLHYGLAGILLFVGGKMLLSERISIPPLASLGVVAGILAVSIGLSLLLSRKPRPKASA